VAKLLLFTKTAPGEYRELVYILMEEEEKEDEVIAEQSESGYSLSTSVSIGEDDDFAAFPTGRELSG
jgi:hypothetical protein